MTPGIVAVFLGLPILSSSDCRDGKESGVDVVWEAVNVCRSHVGGLQDEQECFFL